MGPLLEGQGQGRASFEVRADSQVFFQQLHANFGVPRDQLMDLEADEVV